MGQTLPAVSEPMAAALQAQALAHNIERDALQTRLRETVTLEAARTGHKAGRLPVGGPVRLRTRDGLDSLLSAGSISEEEAAAGLAYRLCFEGLGAGLRSAMGDINSTHGRKVQAALVRDPAALHRAYLMARLNQMEQAVGEAMVDGRELLILRAVAGEGHTIRAVAGGAKAGGDVKAKYVVALRRALAAIVIVLATPKRVANQAR